MVVNSLNKLISIVAKECEAMAVNMMIASAPFVIWMKDYTDGKGVAVYVNTKFVELYGVQAEDYLGRTDYELFPREYAALWEESDREVLEKNKTLVRYQRDINKQGKIINVIVYKWRIDYAGRFFVAGFTLPDGS